jgi:hypothetical protein
MHSPPVQVTSQSFLTSREYTPPASSNFPSLRAYLVLFSGLSHATSESTGGLNGRSPGWCLRRFPLAIDLRCCRWFWWFA